ncbi:MAG: ATP-binding protein [Desulfomonilaceae bacterium]|nr:ATP-binding protein [Desulfomonilaceae bacterium]
MVVTSGKTRRKGEMFSSVDELSAGIAHELNNPLAIIAQETQLLEDVLASPSFSHVPEREDLADSIREIAGQVQRCQEIVEKLLCLARHGKPVVQKVAVNDLVREMTRLVEREATAKRIEIVTNLQTDLPVIESDSPLLRQVLLNLLVNAIRASGEGDSIRVATGAGDDGTVEISVHDTGCGIPKEHVPKIFAPFFSTRMEGKGAGLGLALCRGIVERLGGHIDVASELGRSTTFRVHLPVQWHARLEKNNG